MRLNFIPIFIALIIAIAILLKGIIVLILKRPIIFNNRWFFLIPLLITLYILFDAVIILLLNPRVLNNNSMILAILSMIASAFFFLMRKTTTGYTGIGITDDSFYTVLKNALEQLNIDFKESLTCFELTSLDINLEIFLRPKVGSVELKVNHKKDIDVLTEIVDKMTDYYRSVKVDINNSPAITDIFTGLFLLVICIFILIK